jgi:hypothetical protein
MAILSRASASKPTPPARSGGIATERSPEFSLPLRYFGLGVAAYLVAMLGLVFAGPALTGSPWNPQVLGLTHVMTLGAIVGMIMGASYQMVPVVLLAPIWSQALGKLSFWVFLPGVVAMVAGFWLSLPAWLGIGATLAGVAIAAFLVNLMLSLIKGAHWNMVGAFLVTSLLCLGAAVTLGMIRAFGYMDPAAAWRIPNALTVHAHLAAFGCASLMIFGVSYRLIPMFAVSNEIDRRGWAVLALGVAGITGITLGSLLEGGGMVRGGALLAAASALLWAWDAAAMFRGRVRKKLDAGLTTVYSAIGWLVLAVGMGVALAWAWIPPGISPDRWAIAYALTGLVGFIGFTIIGQFHKIMPFLAWYHRYSSLVGKTKVPLIKDIYDEKLSWFGFWAGQIGLALGVASILAGLGSGVRVAGVLLALGACATAGMTIQTLKR